MKTIASLGMVFVLSAGFWLRFHLSEKLLGFGRLICLDESYASSGSHALIIEKRHEFSLNSSSSIDDQILDALSKDDNLLSQRLILGMSSDYSFGYFFYRTLGVIVKSSMLQGDLGETVLYRINQSLPAGVGGINVRPPTLIRFGSIADLNRRIDTMREKLKREIIVRNGDHSYLVTLFPYVFIDWNMEMKGYNSKILSQYAETKDNPQEYGPTFVSNIHVNGVFSPYMDYYPGIEATVPATVDYVNTLGGHGILAFAKHFGYRNDYRTDGSLTSGTLDIHKTPIFIVTPKQVFLREDLPILKALSTRASHQNLGIMVGHHVLEWLDNTQPASLSIKVKEFIYQELGPNTLTISDSADMGGLLRNTSINEIVAHSPLDLILISHLEFWNDSISNFPGRDAFPANFRRQMLRRIFVSKRRLGLLTIRTIRRSGMSENGISEGLRRNQPAALIRTPAHSI